MSDNKGYENCAVIMCEKRKATSVIRKIPPEDLEQVLRMWNDIAGIEIEQHKQEQMILTEKRKAAEDFMEKHNVSHEEAQKIFGSLLGIDNPEQGKKRKSYHPVKYRMKNPDGGSDITWSGRGRRPALFNGLTAEQLKNYEV